MKQLLFPFFALLILVSCRHTSGSGNIVTEKRTTSYFTGIIVSGGFDVEVKIGPVSEVIVEADDNVIKYIETTLKGNDLRIRVEDGLSFSDVHLKVYITTPGLARIKSSSGSEVLVNGVLAGKEKLSFTTSSSGEITAEVDAPGIEAHASSGGTIKLSGKTMSYTATASSGANIKTADLLSESTTVSASSGANASVHASVLLKASASSGADIRYHGAAVVEKSVSSGGSVQKTN